MAVFAVATDESIKQMAADAYWLPTDLSRNWSILVAFQSRLRYVGRYNTVGQDWAL